MTYYIRNVYGLKFREVLSGIEPISVGDTLQMDKLYRVTEVRHVVDMHGCYSTELIVEECK